MKRLLLLLGLLAGCARQPIPPTSGACPPAAPHEPQTPSPPAVATVVQHFDAATKRAIDVVLSPDVTAEQIEAIRSAETRARKALTHLGQVLPRLDQKAMAEARASVQALEDALNK